jgi:4-hydroxybenzoate polyprenyltransferase
MTQTASPVPSVAPENTSHQDADNNKVSITTLAFWAAYVTTMRPYLLPVSGLAGLAGMSLAGSLDLWRFVLGLLAFSLSYGFGQALTDCFQQDTDRLSAPYRPLVRGRVSTGQVLAVSLVGLALGAATLALLNPWNLVVGVAAVAGLLVYTPLKRRWWAGPAANAWVVALLPIMGWLVNPANSLPQLMSERLILLAAAAAFAAYANFVLVGYLKDVSADRQAGYETFPVRFGWRATAWLSHLWAVAALAATAEVMWLLTSEQSSTAWPARSVFGLAALITLVAQASLHRIDREEQAHGPIVMVVRVFLLLEAAVIVAAQPAWWPVAAVFYGAFEFLVAVRPDRRQV